MAVSRKLLGYGYRYNDGYASCADRTGCIVGSIVGAVVFFLIALALVICLVVRVKRQRLAAQAQPYYPSGPTVPVGNQQYVGSGAQYPAPSAYGPGGPTTAAQPTPYGSYPAQQAYNSNAPPTNFANPGAREQWEREQYAKYGEAGLVTGQPVDNSGVQMTNTVQK